MQSRIYDSDVFNMACRQFDRAAQLIKTSHDLRERTHKGRDPLPPIGDHRRGGGSGDVDELEVRLGISRRNAALTRGIVRVARAKDLRGIFP